MSVYIVEELERIKIQNAQKSRLHLTNSFHAVFDGILVQKACHPVHHCVSFKLRQFFLRLEGVLNPMCQYVGIDGLVDIIDSPQPQSVGF